MDGRAARSFAARFSFACLLMVGALLAFDVLTRLDEFIGAARPGRPAWLVAVVYYSNMIRVGFGF